MRSLFLTTLCVLVPQSDLLAQAQPTQAAPADVLRAFGLRGGTVTRLDLPQRTAAGFALDIEIAGAARRLALEPHEMRAADFQLIVDDGTALRTVPAPDPGLFRGAIDGDPDAIIAAQVYDHRLRATLRLAGATWAIEPVRDRVPAADPSDYVMYQRGDVIRPADLRCGNADIAPDGAPAEGSPGPDSVVLKETEIALDLDRDYYVRKGSSVNNAMAAAFSTLNDVDAIYQADVGITYILTTVLVRTSTTYTSTDMGTLLNQFRNRWRSSHSNIRRDIAHLFTGKGSFSGTIGIAWLGQICSTNRGYAVSKAYSAPTDNAGLVAHELGHNWDAPHCDSSSPCNIMCSGLGGCSGSILRFGTASQNAITSYRNGRSCLTNRDSGAPGDYRRLGFFGCIGTPGPVIHSAFGFARIGHTGYYAVSGAPSGANTFLIFGLSDQTWNGVPLPVDLGIIGAPFCLAYIDHLVVLGGTADSAGTRTVTYQYPNAPFFIGAQLFSQFYVIDPGANALGLTTSNGYATTIGA